MLNSNVADKSESSQYYYLDIHHDDASSVYLDEADYLFFLSILEKYLSKNSLVEALAYCLEPNHTDLLLFQTKDYGIKKLINNIITSYNQYYLDKYGVGNLLSDNSYRLAKILPNNLLEISRSMHTSPDKWVDYPYSSLRAYFYDDVPDWLNKDHIANQYGSAIKYLKFLKN